MSFPTTGGLDDFNRGDAATLGANWSHIHLAGSMECGISGNQCYPVGAQFGGYTLHFWNPGTVGPDCEGYVRVPAKCTATTDILALYAAISNISDIGACDGYDISVATAAGADIWTIDRIDDGVVTQLGASMTRDYADGDSVGIECVGDTIRAWHLSGETWTEVGSRTDSSHGSAGYLGFYATSVTVTWRLDNFAGGTVVAASTGQPMQLRGLQVPGMRQWQPGMRS